ncbi:MAG: PadR family transcriptional regulator [Opitutaceae bacterium]
MKVEPFSVLSVSILGQVLLAPQSGYSLKRMFEETAMGHFSSSPGAIYPALQRMERAGWIQGEVENPKALRARRVYRLTKQGRAILKALFETPLTRDDIIHRMDLVLLRFAFMTSLAGRPATVAYLRDLAGLLETYVRELKRQSDQLAHAPLEGVLALQHGIESYKTSLNWARSSLRKLQAAKSKIS